MFEAEVAFEKLGLKNTKYSRVEEEMHIFQFLIVGKLTTWFLNRL